MPNRLAVNYFICKPDVGPMVMDGDRSAHAQLTAAADDGRDGAQCRADVRARRQIILLTFRPSIGFPPSDIGSGLVCLRTGEAVYRKPGGKESGRRHVDRLRTVRKRFECLWQFK